MHDAHIADRVGHVWAASPKERERHARDVAKGRARLVAETYEPSRHGPKPKFRARDLYPSRGGFDETGMPVADLAHPRWVMESYVGKHWVRIGSAMPWPQAVDWYEAQWVRTRTVAQEDGTRLTQEYVIKHSPLRPMGAGPDWTTAWKDRNTFGQAAQPTINGR